MNENEPRFLIKIPRWIIIAFWVILIAGFGVIYWFYPSLYNQMRQVSYQNTPYVDTPLKP